MDLTLHKTKITSSKGSVIQIPQVKAKYIYGIKMIKEIYFFGFFHISCLDDQFNIGNFWSNFNLKYAQKSIIIYILITLKSPICVINENINKLNVNIVNIKMRHIKNLIKNTLCLFIGKYTYNL